MHAHNNPQYNLQQQPQAPVQNHIVELDVIRDLLSSQTPGDIKLSDHVSKLIVNMTDEFVDSILTKAMRLAAERDQKLNMKPTVDLSDFHMALQMMEVPFVSPVTSSLPPASTTAAIKRKRNIYNSLFDVSESDVKMNEFDEFNNCEQDDSWGGSSHAVLADIVGKEITKVSEPPVKKPKV